MSWDQEGSRGLVKVVAAVLGGVTPALEQSPSTRAADRARSPCPWPGTVARVLAVDISVAAIELLDAKAHEAGIDTIQSLAQPIESLKLDAGSVDLVVSNYALHHLRDAD